jgi:hypothetical protein
MGSTKFLSVLVVVQFNKEASQTRDYYVAKSATLRLRSGQAAPRGSPRSFVGKNRPPQDDNQTAPLPVSSLVKAFPPDSVQSFFPYGKPAIVFPQSRSHYLEAGES